MKKFLIIIAFMTIMSTIFRVLDGFLDHYMTFTIAWIGGTIAGCLGVIISKRDDV